MHAYWPTSWCVEPQCYHFCVSGAGYLLVGGKSSRMGRPKALLPFEGAPLGRALARVVERAAGSVVLVGTPEIAEAIGYPAIADRYPGEGPLGGILTALEHSGSDFNLVVACDMPALTVEFLASLMEAAGLRDADVLLPVGAANRPEPLCAVYHRRSLGRLAAVFADGQRKIMTALSGLNVMHWPVADTEVFQNVNTPEDWAPWAGRYAAQ